MTFVFKSNSRDDQIQDLMHALFEFALRAVIGRRIEIDTIGIHQFATDFNRLLTARLVHCDREAAVILTTVMHGTSVRPSPT